MKVIASADGNQLVSMLPIEVFPDRSLQAGLEVVSRDLLGTVGDEITIQHIFAGAIATMTVRV